MAIPIPTSGEQVRQGLYRALVVNVAGEPVQRSGVARHCEDGGYWTGAGGEEIISPGVRAQGHDASHSEMGLFWGMMWRTLGRPAFPRAARLYSRRAAREASSAEPVSLPKFIVATGRGLEVDVNAAASEMDAALSELRTRLANFRVGAGPLSITTLGGVAGGIFCADGGYGV